MNPRALERPFANGTEGRAWEAAWCANCIHDHDPNHGPDGVVDTGCLHLTHALVGETPLIWQPYAKDWWRWLPAKITCRAFEPCECDRELELIVDRDYAGIAAEDAS